ncbi:hypothetical protein CVT25_009262 [Psilocybe cyanescens]|uniref:Glycan binding protein Y3-like domain-containing protein n=1 Tax=Psilocybe cyanescens TaxID=93625 RepID=A0A409XTT7_PSICY|nr:hypothetical protein CVT25_009262 [Psilocybe cyanescens]
MAQKTFGQISCEISHSALAAFNCASLIQPFCDHLTSSAVKFNGDDELFRCFFNSTTNGTCILRIAASSTAPAGQISDDSTCSDTLFAISGQCPKGGFGSLPGATMSYAINAIAGGCNMLIAPP